MMRRRSPWFGERTNLLSVMTAVTFALATSMSLAADQTPQSLKIVPANAEYYSAMLRNAEQLEALQKTKAWKKLMEMDAVKQGWEMAEKELFSEQSPLTAFLKDPENKALVALLGDMCGREIFMYSPGGSAEFFTLLSKLSVEFQELGPQLAADPNVGTEMARQILLQLNENHKLIKFPSMVMGFHVDKPKRAEAQLARLEKLALAAAETIPPLKGRVKKSKIGKGSYLTLSLDGKLIPWNQIPIEDIEKEAGEFKDLMETLKNLTLTISIGLHDDFLIVNIGDSTKPLTALGTGKTLNELDEFAPLRKHAEKKLTSVSYVSKAFNVVLASMQGDMASMTKQLETGLEETPLTQEQKQRIVRDLTDLVKEFAEMEQEPGASMEFSFLTKDGSESFAYDWTKYPKQATPRPLSLLKHVGGDPLIAVVGRPISEVQSYPTIVKTIKMMDGWVDDLLLPMLPPASQPQVTAALGIIRPLVKRLDQTTGKMLIPSMSDGESALVVDAKLSSKQWHQMMPEAAKPLPLFEPALVCALSDAALLEKAMADYRKIINDGIKQVGELSGQELPFSMPAAETKKLSPGTLYFYPVLEAVGFDGQLAPSAVINSKVASFAMSPTTAERLGKSTPIKAGGLLSDNTRPLYSASTVNFAGLIETLKPWLDYGIAQGMENQPDDKENLQMVAKQVHAGLEILSVFNRYSSYTYQEGKAIVRHSETIIRDLGEKP